MIGIVGCGQDKLAQHQIPIIKELICSIIDRYPDEPICSGRSPKLGTDFYAEAKTKAKGREFIPYEPKVLSWDTPKGSYGFRARNLDIAKSRVVHVIVVKNYPYGYQFDAREKQAELDKRTFCYHCESIRNPERLNHHGPHVKSGGCWTGWKAIEFGNEAVWHII